ncbi:MAG: invasion associated locus B family protein [Paracoccaceae bacterium]|jgi:invasion protein IalB|nr:invasion associated locus B family protein [Paracoccaceae bacterium]
MTFPAHAARSPQILAAALAAALAFAAPVPAQDGDVPLDLGTPVGEEAAPAAEDPRLGEAYLLELAGDWQIQCVRTALEHDPCAMQQTLVDEGGNPTATIELFNLPEGSEAVAGATIVTPLETLLTRQVTLSVDGGQAKRYPFTVCTQSGCIARVGFTQADLDAFRRGAEALLTIVPAGAPNTEVALPISLMGVTDGYDRIVELNALNTEARAAARAAQE